MSVTLDEWDKAFAKATGALPWFAVRNYRLPPLVPNTTDPGEIIYYRPYSEGLVMRNNSGANLAGTRAQWEGCASVVLAVDEGTRIAEITNDLADRIEALLPPEK